MFRKLYSSNKRRFRIKLTIKGKNKCEYRVVASAYGYKNSKYVDRVINVDKERTIYLSFPISPDTLFITVSNVNNIQDKSFEVQLVEEPIKDYAIWLNLETRRFFQLAEYFCKSCGYSEASKDGIFYETENKEFRIRYYTQIRNPNTGEVQNTPARIGNATGIIDISQEKFIRYTIPMRMVIILHEFSHKFKNPAMGLRISNEKGADINALYMYLGSGYSKIDAITVFAKVFLKAQTKSNMERMRYIMDYIQKFENGEFAKLN